MYIFDNILKYNYQLKFSSLMGYFFYNFNSDCFHTKTTFGSLQVIFENPVLGDCTIFFLHLAWGGAQRPVWRITELKKAGVRSARAHARPKATSI